MTSVLPPPNLPAVGGAYPPRSLSRSATSRLDTDSNCALDRCREDSQPSSMRRQDCCLPQQWRDRLCLRLDELRNRRVVPTTPPALCFAHKDGEPTVLVLSGQLRISGVSALGIPSRCSGETIVASPQILRENMLPQTTKPQWLESPDSTGRLVSPTKTWLPPLFPLQRRSPTKRAR